MPIKDLPWSYREASAYIGLQPRPCPAPRGRKTWLVRLPNGDVALWHHQTAIAVWHADGTTTLCTQPFWDGVRPITPRLDGATLRYRTVRDRLREYTGARIHGKPWLVATLDGDDVPFHDGMQVDADGEPIAPLAEVVA